MKVRDDDTLEDDWDSNSMIVVPDNTKNKESSVSAPSWYKSVTGRMIDSLTLCTCGDSSSTSTIDPRTPSKSRKNIFQKASKPIDLRARYDATYPPPLQHVLPSAAQQPLQHVLPSAQQQQKQKQQWRNYQRQQQMKNKKQQLRHQKWLQHCHEMEFGPVPLTKAASVFSDTTLKIQNITDINNKRKITSSDDRNNHSNINKINNNNKSDSHDSTSSNNNNKRNSNDNSTQGAENKNPFHRRLLLLINTTVVAAAQERDVRREIVPPPSSKSSPETPMSAITQSTECTFQSSTSFLMPSSPCETSSTVSLSLTTLSSASSSDNDEVEDDEEKSSSMVAIGSSIDTSKTVIIKNTSLFERDDEEDDEEDDGEEDEEKMKHQVDNEEKEAKDEYPSVHISTTGNVQSSFSSIVAIPSSINTSNLLEFEKPGHNMAKGGEKEQQQKAEDGEESEDTEEAKEGYHDGADVTGNVQHQLDSSSSNAGGRNKAGGSLDTSENEVVSNHSVKKTETKYEKKTIHSVIAEYYASGTSKSGMLSDGKRYHRRPPSKTTLPLLAMTTSSSSTSMSTTTSTSSSSSSSSSSSWGVQTQTPSKAIALAQAIISSPN